MNKILSWCLQVFVHCGWIEKPKQGAEQQRRSTFYWDLLSSLRVHIEQQSQYDWIGCWWRRTTQVHTRVPGAISSLSLVDRVQTAPFDNCPFLSYVSFNCFVRIPPSALPQGGALSGMWKLYPLVQWTSPGSDHNTVVKCLRAEDFHLVKTPTTKTFPHGKCGEIPTLVTSPEVKN